MKTFIDRYLVPILLTLIVLAGLALRVHRVDTSPKGALIDEAHFGYLAYSLLETGKDEHGISYPLIFKGFGDNKLPAGAYLMMPVVKFIGLSNATIRIPSIIAGTLLILTIFLLVKELKLGKWSALTAALLTAISPWPFFLSRFGFESNLGMFFFTLGLLGVVKAKNNLASKQTVYPWLVLGSLALAATWYSYIPYRPVSLAVLITFWIGFILNKAKLHQASQRSVSAFLASTRRYFTPILVSVLTLIVVVAPLLLGQAAAANSTRLHQVGIFNDPGSVLLINENRTFCDWQLPRLLCYSIWNKPSVMMQTIVARFAHSFSPQFLATEGEGEIEFLTIDSFGQFYSIWYVFFIVGIFWLVASQLPQLQSVKKHLPQVDTDFFILVVAGLVFAPIPTVLVGEPQPVRISPLFPFLILVIVIGLGVVVALLKHTYLRMILLVFVSGVTGYQAVSFFTNYYSVHTIKNEYYYQSYLPGLHDYLTTVDDNTQIAIKPFYSDPLMFYAYYTKMDPAEYQQKAVLGELEASGFQHTVGLGNLFTTSDSISYIGCQALKNNQSAIFITNETLKRPILYQGESKSGVHNFVYVYDATTNLDPELCQE